ncbi:flagellar filament capping protein FliD [Arcobacter sp. LA11]|uniref:flagellar filament capping protein FliD n=1 Tax=Arcobacter sp. LA11 TaxID=1898176 RepID=UPI000934C665|nr:flagellar filament capping protein FliD [Arcobacter sp. LA11]
MAEGVLGLGAGASSLNNELIEKLKEAERASTVAPLETYIEDISGEGGESEKIKEIIAKANELLETIKPFDLFVTGGQTAFDNKTANVTGTSVIFDAVDAASINEGSTKVNISQLAQRDVFQTNTFSDSSEKIRSSIVLDGQTYTTSGEDFSLLATEIDNGTFTASYDSVNNEITINNNTGSGDKVFSTDGKSYADLITDITADATFTASALSEPDSEGIITLAQSGRPVYQSDITVTADEVVDASGTGTITINAGGTDKIFTVTDTMTYSELVDLISADDDLNAKLTTAGRLSITHADEKTSLTITESLTTSSGLSLGEKYSTEGQTYAELAESINANSNYTASIETVGTDTNRIVIKSVETGLDNAINITQNGVDLGLGDVGNHTVTAQNLLAEVDGIDYNVSSNILIVDGGLKITAVEENEVGEYSSISVNKDTTTIEPALQNFVTIYNELVSLVEEELYSSESKIEDKSTLRSMMTDIKDKLFGSYGTDDDLNIFNFGFEIDKSGLLSLDSTKFNEATETDIESLKSLFVGVAEDRGLGTQLKDYVDSLDGFEGLLSTYEANMDSRKESLEEEKDKAIETLDNKYALLAQQFAAYNAIINQFETQFSGLKLMIDQSVASG